MSVLFEDFVLVQGSAVSLQVINHIKRKILAGEMNIGDELPSRRKLAVQLGINPNTVQKIYKQLEEEGIIKTSNTAKSIICADEKVFGALKSEVREEEMKKTLLALKQSGVTFREVIDMITKLWDE